MGSEGARAQRTVVPVTTTLYGMEFSAHTVPKRYKEDVAATFPGLDLEGLLIVPTCQNSAVDLVQMGDEVETEKDRLLERFMGWAKLVCEKLDAKGHWCDYMDPCSGLAVRTKECNVPYGEVEALGTLLGYSTANAGCCKVILHPKWGSSIYPSSLFTKAPVEDLLQAIKEVEADPVAQAL